MVPVPDKKSSSPRSPGNRPPRSRPPRTSLPSSESPQDRSPPPRLRTPTSTEELKEQFRELRLPMFREHFQKLAEQAARESLSHPQYLAELTRLECQTRQERRIQRLLEQSHLPHAKSWENFDWKRIPLAVARQAESLQDGSFLDRRENLLVFGKPGSGKTHCVCALAQRLIQQGRSMLFTSCGLLVQSLLAAKRDLRFAKAIKQLSRFDGLILDDLGYVQHSREEMEVLFALLAERYERGSVLLTSNLPFSQWEQIFKDAMTTAAAIDRLVHHCVIWELNVPSYRLENAKKNRRTSSPTATGPEQQQA